jgi:hypothetical protein
LVIWPGCIPDFFHTIEGVISGDQFELAMPSAGEAFDAYAALRLLALERGAEPSEQAGGLGGWLLAVFGLEKAGIAALVAGVVAGAGVLAVDGDRERAKQLLRHGICDFVVNDLDEALRILKNEIRKKQAVAVCLSAGPEDIAREMVARGVQPEGIAGRDLPEAGRLRERGAARLDAGAAEGELIAWKLREEADVWAAGPVLEQVDVLAAAALEENAEDTKWRRRWLQRAPRYMGRKLSARRCVRMSDAEAARLGAAIRADAALAGKVVLSRDGALVAL